MLQNYLKTAFRSLYRNKIHSFINVSGLAVGVAACLILFVVIKYEMGYENFQPGYSNIYHVVTRDKFPDGEGFNPGIPFPALEALRQDIPQVKTGALFCSYGSQVTIPDNSSAPKKFLEDIGIFFADKELFEVFKYNWLAGSASVLNEPNNVVLVKSVAEKYFGTWQNAMGKIVRLDNTIDLKVNGVLDNIPGNTDFPFRVVGSFITMKNTPYYGYSTDWGMTTSNFQVYMSVPPNLDAKMVEKLIQQQANKYYKNNTGNHRDNYLRPLSEIHFDTQLGNLGTHVMAKSTLTTMAFIGFLIILMACINFINLSTAQAVKRSKEVGVRKVLGGNRLQLFWQMLSETQLIVLISALIGCILAIGLLPFIKHIVSIEEDLTIFSVDVMGFLLAVILSVTVLAGIYPSLILSGFKPVLALKNRITSATIGGISLRRALVVTQFSISQILIIGTIVAITQMDYIKKADLGFNKEAVLAVNFGALDSSVLSKQAALKHDLLKVSGVESVSFSSDVPSSDNNSGTNFAFDHKPDENYTLFTKFADEDYFKTFGLKFIAGQGYKASDTVTEVVVNETFLKKLSVKTPQEAIGKQMRTGSGRWRTICGVVEDFKTNSLREKVKPMMISSRKRFYGIGSVKLKTKDMQRSREEIQKIWESYYPQYVYTASFMDERIENFYRQENQMTLIYKLFAGLAIFISCLGLYGLVSFMAVQKTKEVGIRKVLGANVGSIVYLFSKEFTILIGIAFMLAAPTAWFFMNKWLENFAYKISIGAGVFVLAIGASIFVAWASVGYKAFRAAIVNPVKSLRSE